ncbi:insulin-like growth factor-binding protein complex acid labile subunit isoform X3 [Palaemon carinicauda]|uniref:insulin-like growth factor-binding protein complex acid labile subunit isoform X3 n=1 Tax=Palaemon carinicauda TaxID=392227 RepID=UPI0035B59106
MVMMLSNTLGATMPGPFSATSPSPCHCKAYTQMKSLLLGVMLVLSLLLQKSAAAAAGERKLNVAESPRVITCPSIQEIHPCTCRVMSKGLDIVCDHADDKHVLSALAILKRKPFTIYWMKFRNCKMPRVPDYLFMGLQVKHLNIIRSNVSTIERSSLSALGMTLQSLDLANNNIREVPTAALNTLKVLTFLNLNYNQIQVINHGAFGGLTVLERLSLYENKIAHIDDNAFKGIGRKLIRLNLGKNNLDDIPTDTFHPLINLEVLDLHENKIHHIPDGAFKGLHKLDILKLEYNLITTIQDDVFSDLGVLNSLNIEHNHIVNISDRAFAGLESHLEWLELGNNRLDHIPSHALRPLHNLRQLDLDANKITDIQEDAFHGYGDTIKYILLDKNHISHIPPNAFRDLHSLEWLKLSHNNIKELPEETVMPILDTLTMIDVANNPLVCNCDLLWLKSWLSNPHNQDHVESAGDHICHTKDRIPHAIANLPEGEFNCPPRLPEVVPVTQAAPQITPTRRQNATSGIGILQTTPRAPDSASMLTCSPLLTTVAIVSTYCSYLSENPWLNNPANW